MAAFADMLISIKHKLQLLGMSLVLTARGLKTLGKLKF